MQDSNYWGSCRRARAPIVMRDIETYGSKTHLPPPPPPPPPPFEKEQTKALHCGKRTTLQSEMHQA